MADNMVGVTSPSLLKYWGMLKNLDDAEKLELIALLSNSVVYKNRQDLLKVSKEERKRNLMSLAGCWADNPVDAANMESIIKSVRENDHSWNICRKKATTSSWPNSNG